MSENPRVGIGKDFHEFSPNRKLIIGGVEIPNDMGLEGHSDGDPLAHAIIDALLGATHLGEIGDFFPSDDDRFKDASSMNLLEETVNQLSLARWVIGNVDSIVVCSEIKLADYKKDMEGTIAKILGLPAEEVSVKFKSNSEFDKKGISAEAIAVVSKIS